MDKINLIVHCPNMKDATSFYRGIGPLSVLRKQIDLNLVFTSEYHWATLAMADALFMQRPYTSQHFTMIELAKLNKVPVWVDYDDDLFNVPISNPAHSVYSRADVKESIARCIAHADYVSVSTTFLKAQFEKFEFPLNKNIEVIPNALHTDLLDYRTPPNNERKPLVMWRGSHTHHKDIASFQHQIVKAAQKHPKWTFHFQGDKPWFLFEALGNNAVFGAPIDMLEYFQFIHRVKPSIVIVPLDDNVFNRSKSNIAWMEGIFSGAVVLAPDWDEWKRPGCINYKNPADFADKLDQLIAAQPDWINKKNAEGWDYISDNLMLRDVNYKRKEILEKMINGKNKKHTNAGKDYVRTADLGLGHNESLA